VCRSVSQCVVLRRSVSQCVALCRIVSQCVALCRGASQCVQVSHTYECVITDSTSRFSASHACVRCIESPLLSSIQDLPRISREVLLILGLNVSAVSTSAVIILRVSSFFSRFCPYIHVTAKYTNKICVRGYICEGCFHLSR